MTPALIATILFALLEVSQTRNFMIQLHEYEPHKSCRSDVFSILRLDTRKDKFLMRDNSTLPLFSLQLETKEIPLTQGKVAIVDAADYEWLSQWKWYAQKDRNTFYAKRCGRLPDGKKISVLMHKEILRVASGLRVDHRDCDGLNNTRDNLRPATNQQNGWNRRLSRNNTSGYKGVSWRKRENKWQAKIMINGRTESLGRFKSAADAGIAYDTAARAAYGDFALANFEAVSE